MSLIDALIITALGMGVVFIGLILTAMLITSFGLVARFQEARADRSHAVAQADAPMAAGPVDDATLAVIWTVLEVERRLNRAGEPWRSR
jgi:Na+-transporting methylmalonyl-CoA/oxaloacetate decarboxylase gamma subunit